MLMYLKIFEHYSDGEKRQLGVSAFPHPEHLRRIARAFASIPPKRVETNLSPRFRRASPENQQRQQKQLIERHRQEKRKQSYANSCHFCSETNSYGDLHACNFFHGDYTQENFLGDIGSFAINGHFTLRRKVKFRTFGNDDTSNL